MLESVPSHQLADIMASIINASFNEKLEILNAVDLKERFLKALPLLLRQIEGNAQCNPMHRTFSISKNTVFKDRPDIQDRNIKCHYK